MSDCVPYAIHIVSGAPLSTVIEMAIKRGWDAEEGMSAVAGWCLLRDMGLSITPMMTTDSKPTIASFVKQIDPAKIFILSVKEHWIAVRMGVIHDKAATHPRTVVTNFFEIKRPL